MPPNSPKKPGMLKRRPPGGLHVRRVTGPAAGPMTRSSGRGVTWTSSSTRRFCTLVSRRFWTTRSLTTMIYLIAGKLAFNLPAFGARYLHNIAEGQRSYARFDE